MSREYFRVYHSYLKAIRDLSDVECGRLFKALLRYSINGEKPEFQGDEKAVFELISGDIDRVKASKRYRVNSGASHWNWKGGITPANQKGRSSIEYAQWRKAVFARDGYVCQACGKRGGRLNAHHKKPWAKFPALRYDVENGVTLCENCHKKEHRSHA